MSVIRQLSLFGIEAGSPGPDDLAGLLAGPGQVVRMGGTARISVVVEERWRAVALTSEMRVRGLAATCVSTVEEHLGVRTPYSSTLAPIASAWLYGAVKRPPAGYSLDGRQLRLWMTAAGERDDKIITLRIGRCEEAVPKTLQRALAGIGLPSEVVSGFGRSGSPALRVNGKRRLNRLAELIGDPPIAAPPDTWP